MLTISRKVRNPTGEFGRRDFLQIGLLGPLGLSLASWQKAQTAGRNANDTSFGRAKRCILVFLNGGPSQLDMWDMKPEAPAEVRGELKPIATNVPGIRLGELLPKTARHADKFKIVRSVTHTASVHTTAMYTMLTGVHHQTPKVDQTRVTPQDHPHLGSIFAKFRGWADQSPPFVCLPSLFQAAPVDGIWPGQNAGFLGRRYDPLVVQGDKQTARYALPYVELPANLTQERLVSRRYLAYQLDGAFRSATLGTKESARGEVSEQAYSLLKASSIVKAASVDLEPQSIRDRYGHHLFGHGMLLSRRLIEAGIPLVTVYWNDPTPAGEGGGEYDSHGRIYWHMRNRLVPPTDQALSALLDDLSQRGMWDDTLVVVMGEFGRTPRINPQAGRDHWPDVQSILLAGAGISGGAVHGASDRHGAYPASDPVSPSDLGQTILHLLGVPADFELHDQQGRPVPASPGVVLPKLIS